MVLSVQIVTVGKAIKQNLIKYYLEFYLRYGM